MIPWIEHHDETLLSLKRLKRKEKKRKVSKDNPLPLLLPKKFSGDRELVANKARFSLQENDSGRNALGYRVLDQPENREVDSGTQHYSMNFEGS